MVPLPGVLLDLFLATSIGLSLVVLLVALYTTDPLEFSAFPVAAAAAHAVPARRSTSAARGSS